MIHTYVIVPVAELTQEMIDAAIQDSINTLRKSLDETQAVLKFDGSPSCFSGYTQYTHEEILAVMNEASWTALDEE